RQPRLPPSPYTTLFRSHGTEPGRQRRAGHAEEQDGREPGRVGQSSRHGDGLETWPDRIQAAERQAPRRRELDRPRTEGGEHYAQDRKSTRPELQSPDHL